jgi:hypothetical protein
MTTLRKPQDHKPKAQTGDFTYEFGDHTVTIPPLSSLMTFGFSRKNRHLSPDDQMYLLIESNLPQETIAVLDEMDGEQTREFITQWQEHSGIDTGESAAS